MSGAPARPGPGVVLCRLDDIAEPGAKGFVFRDGSALFSGFVVRKAGEVRGYVDSCPHAGWRLAGIGDNYLTRDDRFILCAGHGALFRPEDGECVSGPCFGERLEPWPIRVEDGVVMTGETPARAGPPYHGGCRCGAVRYVAKGAPLNVRVCHCRTCQKATGSAFLVRAVFAKAVVEVSGRVERSASSPRLNRSFCPKCGAPLFAEPLDRPQFLAVTTASLDDPGALPPEMHIWVEDKVDWLKLDDGLPQFPQGAPP